MNSSSTNRRSLLLLFPMCCALALGCRNGDENHGAGSSEPLQISFSVVRQFHLPGLTATPENTGTAATRNEDTWATTLSLAPNGKSLVAIAFGQTAVYFDDVKAESPGKPVTACTSPNSICAWTSDSSAFVLFDAPDRLWGDLKLFDVKTLNVIASTKLEFALGAVTLPNEVLLVFQESGEQFSSAKPWRPRRFQIGNGAIVPLNATIPTENCPTMGLVSSIGEMSILLTGSNQVASPLEMWVIPTDPHFRSEVPQKGVVEGIANDSPDSSLRDFVVNADGTQFVTLRSRIDRTNQKDADLLESHRISVRDDEASGPILECAKHWKTSSFDCDYDEIVLPDLVEKRVAFLCDDILIAVAASDALRVYSAATGRFLDQFKIPHCNVVSATNPPSGLIVSTTDGFALLRISCSSELGKAGNIPRVVNSTE